MSDPEREMIIKGLQEILENVEGHTPHGSPCKGCKTVGSIQLLIALLGKAKGDAKK